jgi:transcriptional regulator with XRE-family HTH domain
MKREKLIRSKDYIISQIQLRLLNLIGAYKSKNKLKDYQLAEELGVSKGYVSQLLNATYDHKISKVVDLALSCNTVPLMFFVPIDQYLQVDKEDKFYEIIPFPRQQLVTFQNNVESEAKIGERESILNAPQPINVLSSKYSFIA